MANFKQKASKENVKLKEATATSYLKTTIYNKYYTNKIKQNSSNSHRL